MNPRELYLFNPFTIDKVPAEEIQKTYTVLQGKIIEETDIPYQISVNIEIYSNLCFLLGEMISRIQEEHETLKVEKDIKENNLIYQLRDEYVKNNSDKIPAIDYFKAQAKEQVKEEYLKLSKINSRLFRFKKAYDSCENKMNALKKKIECIKYEN